MMKPKEWGELKHLPEGTMRFEELMKKTESEEEHPEDYDGPCWCRLCQSYAD
jgi:hypothetical protein